jgi:diguanylate cyclase (GGDEF)-like protein
MSRRPLKRRKRPTETRPPGGSRWAIALGATLLVGAYTATSYLLQEGWHLGAASASLVTGLLALGARSASQHLASSGFKGLTWPNGRLRRFLADLRAAGDLSELGGAIVTALDEAFRPEHLYLWLPPAGEPSFHLVTGRGSFPETYVIPEFSLRQLLKVRPEGPWRVDEAEPVGAAASFDELMRSMGTAACLPIVLHGQLLGLITLGPRKNRKAYGPRDLAFLSDCGRAIAPAIAPYQFRAEQALHLSKLEAVSRLYRDAQQKAITDGLTGLTTHVHFQEQLVKRFSEARRFEQPMSLLFIDIDHFKRINDTFGHQTGDEVLRQVAATVHATARSCDTVARYGGEELAMLLPQTDLLGAYTLAERLRESIRTLRIPEAGGSRNVSVTASIGVAQLQRGDHEPADLLERADKAVYEAKHRGRNQVILSAQGA